jgi:hypothetical protein
MVIGNLLIVSRHDPLGLGGEPWRRRMITLGYARNRDSIDKPTPCSDKRFFRPTNRRPRPAKREVAIRRTTSQIRIMAALLVTFVLGIGNFALHKAVLESGHPVLGRMPWFAHLLEGRGSLVLEFFALVVAMLLAGAGMTGWVWAYAGYTIFNAIAAWLILTRRV